VRCIAGAWKTVDGSPAYIAKMRGMWLQSMMNPCQGQEPMALPALKSNRSGPVKATTGLGLPLCRGFAHASGGWLALDQSLDDGMTHFWGVLLSRPSSVHRTGEEAPSTGVLIDSSLSLKHSVLLSESPGQVVASESVRFDSILPPPKDPSVLFKLPLHDCVISAFKLGITSLIVSGCSKAFDNVDSNTKPCGESGIVVTELSPGFRVRAHAASPRVDNAGARDKDLDAQDGNQQWMPEAVSSLLMAATPVWEEDKQATTVILPRQPSHLSRVHPAMDPSLTTVTMPVVCDPQVQ
jgi:hypothetical protein